MKKLTGFVIGVLTAAVLTGCSGATSSGKEYVQGVLDVAYNKGTDGYVKEADVKKEDAQTYRDQSLEAEAKVLAAYFGLNEPSNEVLAIFKDFAGKMYEKVSYTVEVQEDHVQVRIRPLRLFEGEAVQEYINEFNVKQFVDGDASCTDKAFAEGITKLLEKELDQPAYDKEVTIAVKVSEKDGKISISDGDLQKIDEQMVVYKAGTP